LVVLLALSGPAAPENVRLTTTPPSVAFPLKTSADGRYLEDSSGKPFPVLGRASWMVLSLAAPAYERYLDDTLARGFNTVEVSILNHWPDGDHIPFDDAGDAPFLRRLDGLPWNGALRYQSNGRDAPDFTTPNDAYWSNVDLFLDSCATRGILVLLFPAYLGYAGAAEGWMTEMIANGPGRVRAYGRWIASRYKDRRNIVWMLGGDRGTAPFYFNPAELAVEQALVSGMFSVPGQATRNTSAEWSGPIATSEPDFASYMTINGAYGLNAAAFARQAYAYTPVRPAFLLEGPYDEEGPDGNWRNVHATQPVRRFEWWGWLNSIGGYVAGNGYVWPFRDRWWHPRSYYVRHLDTPTTRDLARLNRLISSLRWYDLVPDGLGGIGTLVTAGRGTPDALDYVAAAECPDGSLLVAYAGPLSSAPFTIDLTKMRGITTARWFNPATGSYVPIGSFQNQRPQQFSVPGDNGTGYRDWSLILTSP
jgi:hypothetical protein